MKIKEALFKTRTLLDNLEGERLLSFVLKKPIIELYKDLDYKLKEDEVSFFERLVEKRKEGFPLPYLIGQTEFMGLLFKITDDVLIPRPETEILVNEAIKEAEKMNSPRIIDLGCGSGVIAVSIKKLYPLSFVMAIDCSEKALLVSKENARRHNADISFVCSNLLSSIRGRFDIIVSNPPYVEKDLVLEYEPRIALDGGLNGLDFYPKIFEQGKDLLTKEGLIILEIGQGKEKPIREIGEGYGFCLKRSIKDYSGIERVLVFQLRKP